MNNQNILRDENRKIKDRLQELEQTITAIQEGDVDAVVVHGSKGKQIYSLDNTRINHILANMSDAFFIVDEAWCVVYVNEQAELLSGMKREKVIGKNLWDANPELRKSNLYSVYQQAFQTQQSAHLEKFYPQLNKWFEIRVYPTKDSLAVYYSDITARKELEKQKDEFIAIASHELKTPVTSIKAYTQMLKYKSERNGDQATAAHLAKMDGQLNKLTDLIGDLLDVTKIQAGKLQFHEEHFDFDSLIQESVENMQLTTEKHELIMHGKVSINVFADRERIGQVLTNLISNAIKYSPYANKIFIHISSTEKEVLVSVKDFGVGIPKRNQKRIFEQFYRVSGPNNQTFPGLGLGLYISSEIIKRLGGKIWVESRTGKGSTFHFSIPIGKRKKKQEENTLMIEEMKHE